MSDEGRNRECIATRARTIMAMAVCAISACGLLDTEPEPEPVLPVAHVRVCYTLDGRVSSKGDCRGDGYWGNERVPTRNKFAVPLPGVTIRICYFSEFDECHAQTPGHFRTAETDSDGYAVFPGLVAETYLFLPDTVEVEFDSCALVPIDEYGGVLWVEERVLTTPVEYQDSHIGELWFIKKSCNKLLGKIRDE